MYGQPWVLFVKVMLLRTIEKVSFFFEWRVRNWKRFKVDPTFIAPTGEVLKETVQKITSMCFDLAKLQDSEVLTNFDSP